MLGFVSKASPVSFGVPAQYFPLCSVSTFDFVDSQAQAEQTLSKAFQPPIGLRFFTNGNLRTRVVSSTRRVGAELPGTGSCLLVSVRVKIGQWAIEWESVWQ